MTRMLRRLWSALCDAWRDDPEVTPSSAPPTDEELGFLAAVKLEKRIPAYWRSLTLQCKAKGWVRPVYLEPTGYELTALGERVLREGRHA